jgi:hypothetical protein
MSASVPDIRTRDYRPGRDGETRASFGTQLFKPTASPCEMSKMNEMNEMNEMCTMSLAAT